MTVGMRTAMRLRRQKVKNDKDADAIEVNFGVHWVRTGNGLRLRS